MGKTIKEIQTEIIEEMSGFEEQFEKYQYLIDLGKNFPEISPELKTDENFISGCQSELWFSSELIDGKLLFYADTEAMITRGMIALLFRIVNRQSPQAILEIDWDFLDRIGLRSYLSPSRANGLNAILRRIHESAQRYSE